MARELCPEFRRALGVAQARSELLVCVVTLPSAVALELANIGKPPLREGIPFLSDLIEANPALHGRH